MNAFVSRFTRQKLHLWSVVGVVLICLAGVVMAVRATQLPSPSTPIVSSSSIFGVEITPFNANGGLDLISSPEAETRWARGIIVHWAQIEPASGNYQWNNLPTAEISAALDRGLTPIVVVLDVPAWARPAGGLACGPIAPANYDDFAAFMKGLAQRLPEVRYWEVWNEPDNPPPDNGSGGCWGNPGDPYYGGGAFGAMLNVVYPRIKEGNADAQVLVGGLALDCDPNNPPQGKDCSSSSFLEGILKAKSGDNSQFDAVSFHAYDFYAGGTGHFSNGNWGSAWNKASNSLALSAKARYLQGVLEAYGQGNKPLLNTENALLKCQLRDLTCTSTAEFEQTKSEYVAQVYATSISESLQANIWYNVTGTWGRQNGLTRRDLTPLPAYYAYQFASRTLEKAHFQGRTTAFGSKVNGLRFKTDTGLVYLLWPLDEASHPITIPQSQGVFSFYNAQGQPLMASGNSIELTQTVYAKATLFKLDIGLISRAYAPAGVNAEPTSGLVTTESGGQATFGVWLNGVPNQPVTVTLTSSNPAEGVVSPDMLVFTPSEAGAHRLVTVSGQDDPTADDDVAYIIHLAAISNDLRYEGKGLDVQLVNVNDDIASLVVQPKEGLITDEYGRQATFQVQLSSAPTSTVTIVLVSSNVLEGVVNPATLIFSGGTGGNWSIPQIVTLTGQADGKVDADQPYRVELTTSSADPHYSALAPVQVSAVNLNYNLFRADFNDGEPAWTLVPNDGSSQAVISGWLHLRQSIANKSTRSLAPYTIPDTLTAYRLQAVMQIANLDGSQMGFVFDQQDNLHFNRLVISLSDRKFYIQKYIPDQNTYVTISGGEGNIIGDIPSEAIPLKVVLERDRVTGRIRVTLSLVDNSPVGDLTATGEVAYTSGQAGLIMAAPLSMSAGTTADIQFDYFLLSRLP